MTNSTRRSVLVAGGLVLAHGTVSLARAATGKIPAHPPAAAAAGISGPAATVASEVPPSFPSTDPELVSAVVGAAHTDLERVVELVTARPHLSRAAVDWGFGDWESALGAASHMGRADIAEFLIEHGARPDLFTAAMLGQLAVVRAAVEASPGVQSIPGPHGIPLLMHARAGGEGAAEVVAYLEQVGGAGDLPVTVELSEEQRRRLLGSYGFEADSNPMVHVEENRGALSLRREGAPFGRRLNPVGETEFFPAGSPTVQIVFDVEEGGAATLRVIDSEVSLVARRPA